MVWQAARRGARGGHFLPIKNSSGPDTTSQATVGQLILDRLYSSYLSRCAHKHICLQYPSGNSAFRWTSLIYYRISKQVFAHSHMLKSHKVPLESKLHVPWHNSKSNYLVIKNRSHWYESLWAQLNFTLKNVLKISALIKITVSMSSSNSAYGKLST